MELHSYAHSMQQEMIKEIESNRPKYIVYVLIDMSWLRSAESDSTLFTRAGNYLSECYKMVGFLDVTEDRFAEIEKPVAGYQPQGEMVYIFERVD